MKFMKKEEFESLGKGELTNLTNIYKMKLDWLRTPTEERKETFSIWQGKKDGVDYGYAVADATRNWLDPSSIAGLWDHFKEPERIKFHEFRDGFLKKKSICSSYRCVGAGHQFCLYVFAERSRDDRSWQAMQGVADLLTETFSVLKAAAES